MAAPPSLDTSPRVTDLQTTSDLSPAKEKAQIRARRSFQLSTFTHSVSLQDGGPQGTALELAVPHPALTHLPACAGHG